MIDLYEKQSKNNPIYTGLSELLVLESMHNYNSSIVFDSLRYTSKVQSIVDFGAGIGTLSLIFRNQYNKENICIEIDPINKEYLKNRNFKYFDDIGNLSKKVDMVFSSNVLEHIENDYQILKSISKKIKDDGFLFLYLPANKLLWTKLDEIVGHYRRYDISKLRILCRKAGFQIVRVHYADCLGFFITLLWKFIYKINQNSLPSKYSLIFYDRLIFPLSRLLDNIGFKYLIGKNIVMVAKKEKIT